MANDALDQIRELLNSEKRNSYNQLLDEEDTQAIKDSLARFTKAIEQIEKSLTSIFTKVTDASKELEKELKESPEVFKKYKHSFEHIQELIFKNDASASVAYDSLIEQIQKDKELQEKYGDKLQEKFQKLNDVLDENAIKSALDKIREQQEKGSNFKKMLDRITSSRKSHIDDMFAKVGITFQNSERNVHPYMAIFKTFMKDATEGIELLKAYNRVIFEVYNNMLEFPNMIINVFTNFRKQMIKGITTLDQVSAHFLKATGLTEDYVDKIEESWIANRSFNISMKEIAETYEVLIDNMRSFNLQSRKNQDSIVSYVSKVGSLGVGFDSAAKIMSYFVDTLKQATSEAESSMNSLLGISVMTGDSMKKVTTDFISALPQIAKFGNQTTQVFKEMYATAKSLRIETSELLQLAENFDTFETAAKNVGRLNAILGGPYLNALKMMNQNEAERVQSLNEAFRMTGKNWSALGKYERQAIAATIGINDMTVAEKLFSGSLADSERFLRDRTLTQEELNEKNRRAASIAEKWENIMSSLAIVLEPIVTLVQDITSLFLKWSETLKGWTVPVLFIAASAGWSLVKMFGSLLKTVGGGVAESVFQKLGKALFGIKKPAETASDALEGMTNAADMASKQGVPSMLNAAKGVSTFGVGMVAASAKIALSILMIGGAIAVVVGLFVSIVKIADGISNFFSGLGKTFEGLGNYLSGAGDAFRNNSLTDFMKELNKKEIDPAQKIRSMTEAIKELSSAMANIPSSSLSSYEDLFEQVSDLADNTSNMTSATFMKSLSDFMTVTSKISPQQIQNVQQVTKNISEMSTQIAKDSSIENVLDKLAALLTGNKEEGKQGNAVINVYVNNEKVASKSIDSIYARGISNVQV